MLRKINDYMTLDFSEENDTLIRVVMDYKLLDKKLK